MSARVPFDYEGTDAVSAFYSGAGSIEPLVRYGMVPAPGMLLCLNGISENTRMAAPTEEVLPGLPLMIEAPRAELVPMLTGPTQEGRIFGKGYKWRYRYVRSLTGEASGLSPIPSEGWDLGSEEGADYVGETAIIGLEVGLGTFPYVQDRVELFRNTSGQESLWLKVAEAEYDGSSTQVYFTDNLSDEELSSKEDAALKPNPSYLDGIMPAMSKCHIHSTGRAMYYGVRRRGRMYSTGNSDQMTEGSNDFSPTFYNGAGRELVGFRFRPLTDTTDADIDDDTNYRIVSLSSISPAAKSTVTVKTWEIVDDRDGRMVYQSEPGAPSQIDPTKAFSVGLDRDDDLMHIFQMGGVTFSASRRRLIRWDEDNSDAPHFTTRFQIVAEEGQAGLDAGVVTPFGYVFVNERGVRVFDGASVGALGVGSVYEDFPAAEQFIRFEMDNLADVLTIYDPDHNKVHVSYVRVDGNIPERTMTFDPETGSWRGPNRRHVFSAGTLRNASGEDVFVLGDNLGNLVIDEDAVTDVLPDISTHTISGTITAVSDGNGMVITDSAATFDPDGDAALTGVPIVFTETDGSIQVNWIARVLSTTKLQLLNLPVRAMTTGWAYNIGAIRWRADTAYFDSGESFQPHKIERVRMRFERGTADSFEMQVALDGGAFEDLVDTSHSTVDKVALAPEVKRRAACHQLRLQGTATAGEPRITRAQAEIDVRTGKRT